MSGPLLVKDRCFFDGLQLDQPTSVVVSYATINAERKEPYQARNTNPKTSFEDLTCDEHLQGLVCRGQMWKSLVAVATERFVSGCKNADKKISERPKTRRQATQRTRLNWMKAQQLVE